MSRAARLVVLIPALLAAAATPATAAPALAVQDDRLTWAPLDRLDDRARMIAQTGARWTRVDVFWRDVAPTRPRRPTDPADPAYRWERIDTTLRALRAEGVSAMLTPYRSPRWANGGSGDPRTAPRARAYAQFMVALGRRYSGRYRADGVVLPAVRHFEVWNEPNIAFFLRPQWARRGGRMVPVSPEIYARMLKEVHPRLRRARPDAVVIAGALAPTNTTNAPASVGVADFIRGVRARRAPVMAASQHVYPGAPPGTSRALPSEWGIPAIRRLWGNRPLYVTETGYTTASTPYHRYHVSPRLQARYLPALLRGLAKPGVRMLVWYNLQDHGLWPAGLRTAGGAPKPALHAFQRLTGVR
ncbi:MAG: hypothetical protein MUE51_09685 [Thermoleophilia bacterium]|jgi:hypothetical protein|nr:hypothetical protein [Thermoleophilia bacterium]